MKKLYGPIAAVAAALLLVGCGADMDAASEEEAPATEEVQTEEVVEEEAEPEVSKEFQNALTKAEQYSDTMHMSKAGIFDQLTAEYGEGFSEEAAQYAIDNIDADWNANALAKANEYQDSMAMSPDAVREQLVSDYGEKFTAEEADYAVANMDQ